MKDLLTVDICTVATTQRFEAITEIHAPGQEGELTILPHHASMVMGLRAGKIILMPDNQTIDLKSGFLKIQENQVQILLFEYPSD
tara:strand:+ start:42 stop:296 length:255 start_codon:yes stop_codon:yes gene_type:complete